MIGRSKTDECVDLPSVSQAGELRAGGRIDEVTRHHPALRMAHDVDLSRVGARPVSGRVVSWLEGVR